MLNNFLKHQLNHNVNETNRIHKLSKKADNFMKIKKNIY
jgi:hypothetical protein